MSNPLRNAKLAWGCAAGIAVISWLLPKAGAQGGRAAVADAGKDVSESPPRIYYKAPVSAEAAVTWIKLDRKVPMKFGALTLEEFLKKVQEATIDKQETDGVMIYVDPVGLTEVEKTQSSPVSLNLSNVKIRTALELALDQLELRFYVTEDGIVRITDRDGKLDVHEQPMAVILDRLDDLRSEVRQLHALKTQK